MKLTLISKQNNIAITYFAFKNLEDNSEFAMRVHKESPLHEELSKMNEGDEYELTFKSTPHEGLQEDKNVSVGDSEQ